QFALRGNFERWVPSGTDSGEIQKDPLRWLLVERRSLSSAIYQSVTLGDDELAWHLALLAKRAYSAHSRFDEWRQTHEHVLDATRASGNRRGEAAILHSLAQLSSVSRPGDEGWRTLDLLTEALTTFTEIGDGQGRGVTLLEMAKEQRRSGEIDAALDSCRLAQRLLRAASDGTTEALALLEEADLLRRSGRIREAQASVIELRRQERDLPPRLHPLLLRQTARLYMEQGRLDDATEALSQALDLVQASGDVAGRASLFHLLGRVAWRTGAVDDAQSHLDQAMKLSQQVGIRSFYEQAAWSLERVLAGLDPSDPSPPKRPGPTQTGKPCVQVVPRWKGSTSHPWGPNGTDAEGTRPARPKRAGSGSRGSPLPTTQERSRPGHPGHCLRRSHSRSRRCAPYRRPAPSDRRQRCSTTTRA